MPRRSSFLLLMSLSDPSVLARHSSTVVSCSSRPLLRRIPHRTLFIRPPPRRADTSAGIVRRSGPSCNESVACPLPLKSNLHK